MVLRDPERSGDGTADALREKLIPAIDRLGVGVSTESDTDYGPAVNGNANLQNYFMKGADQR